LSCRAYQEWGEIGCVSVEAAASVTVNGNVGEGVGHRGRVCGVYV
jgi:hypothetical protein